ncbi:hypothetical protein K474DRAFT_1604790 [Panus rudis PR-1116 ss-1]|nr:hypothetical protein K474DRAFT_1604790 [Panus rudis PR-1116 ss-1]
MDPSTSVAVLNQPVLSSTCSLPAGSEQFTRIVEEYPHPAGETFGEGLTKFEEWREAGIGCVHSDSPWTPFEDKAEWDLAYWMGRNLGHNQIKEFLKLHKIQSCDLSMASSYSFFQKVDSLPDSQRWFYDDVTVVGDRPGEDQTLMTERLELWRRDPIECIRELVGNPEFREAMAYSPQKVFTDMGRNVRVYDEMWTGHWWWEMQEKLPKGATIAPVILASDKTQLSQFRGDQTAWPVYLSIANIAKATCRKVSERAMILLGYIPVSKLECFKPGPGRSLAGYRLFHHCMRSILEPLIEAGKNGVMMLCADGKLRRVFPLLAAYIADHPEQCLVVNVKENRCPSGTVLPDERGELSGCLLRKVEDTLDLLNKHKHEKITDDELLAHGLRPVYDPFWKDLPHCNIHEVITPDILHQLHKGVFKDHLIAWIAALIGKEELDRRFMAMSQMPGLRYFKKGISNVSQWTGAEHKEMQKVVVALLSGAVCDRVLACVQAIVDFIYLAQFQVHTDVTLACLHEALETFHANKDVFIELLVRKNFNIPKLHALIHYIESIRRKGALDGFNTELSERLHIDFAKEAYRAGNHRDYIAFMTQWLFRQEKLNLRERYLRWLAQQEEQEEEQRRQRRQEHERQSTAPPSPQARAAHELILAKECAWKKRSLEQLEMQHGATQFHATLLSYVRKNYVHVLYRPTQYTHYGCYRQVKVLRPWNPYTGNPFVYDRIRAIPAVAEKGRTKAMPGVFDTVLVVEDREAFANAPVGSVRGVRAARVRVIFDLPPQFLSQGGCRQKTVAYVEWYTPFTRVDVLTQMYYVSRSTRNTQPNASIVDLEDILGPCHLVPRCHANINRTWTSNRILDVAEFFFVNPYLSIDTFSSSGLYRRLSADVPG